MSRIGSAFHHGKAFIPFITCGDPSLTATEQIIYAFERAGADLIELGIPFSDPMAEGETIQKANIRALANNVTCEDIFQMVSNIRKNTNIPLVFMTYANVVFSYGVEPFISRCAQIGMDGLILPDVPFEEKSEFADLCQKYHLDFISMVTPTSSYRIQRIAQEAKGFLYCVSSLGVTGIRSEITTDVGKMVAEAKKVTNIPCAIGFGISTSQQACRMAAQADGVIIGSAIVKLCEQYGQKAIPAIEKYVTEIVTAIRD